MFETLRSHFTAIMTEGMATLYVMILQETHLNESVFTQIVAEYTNAEDDLQTQLSSKTNENRKESCVIVLNIWPSTHAHPFEWHVLRNILQRNRKPNTSSSDQCLKNQWVVPQDMLQTPAYDTYLHNVASYPGPGSQSSRMTPQKWMYGRSWRRPDQMSTRRLPSCMASQIWGVCWGGWRRYQKRKRNVKVCWLAFRYDLKILSALVWS